jgi:GTPase
MTLSTTIWAFKVDEQASILFIDTVGFISRLPTYMIDAFKSTFEESLGADLVLVVDSSEDLETSG